jgi:hypothetical protein
MGKCKNCGSKLIGKFCQDCGQKAKTGELTFQDLRREAWHSMTHTDSGLLKLMIDLTLTPKSVYLNYFEGQRKKYFKPITFFLLTASLLLFLGIKIFDYQDYRFHTLNEFGRYTLLETKFRALLLLPLQILLTWIVSHAIYNVPKNIVFWLFLNGFIFAIQIAFTPFYFLFIGHKRNIDIIILLVQNAIILYHLILVFGNKQWYKIIYCFLITILLLGVNNLMGISLLLGDKMYTVTKASNIFELMFML